MDDRATSDDLDLLKSPRRRYVPAYHRGILRFELLTHEAIVYPESNGGPIAGSRKASSSSQRFDDGRP